jgi:hypothetical protein
VFPGIDEWVDMVRQGAADGKEFQRVHVVTEPLSDYVRFECAWAYRHNVVGGEDVRIIAVKQGEWPEGVPRHDYWLFDPTQLVVMRYGEDGSFVSVEAVDDEAGIVQANEWRDRAVERSTAFSDYARGFDDLMRERDV